jgi:uncharacterized membrane protein
MMTKNLEGGRMSRTKNAFRYLMAIFMVGAGTMHFVKPEFYLKIMPPYLPLHLKLVYLSGFFEVAFGVLLLVPRLTRSAAWGIVVLLIAVYPANIYAHQHQELVPATPIVHLLRLPLQVVFLLWAYWLAGPSHLGKWACEKVQTVTLLFLSGLSSNDPAGLELRHADMRIIRLCRRRRQQYQRCVQTRRLVRALNQFPPDALPLVLLVHGEVGQVGAVGEVGDRP